MELDAHLELFVLSKDKAFFCGEFVQMLLQPRKLFLRGGVVRVLSVQFVGMVLWSMFCWCAVG